MKSFYCRYNENSSFPFTEGETYHAFMKQGDGWNVYDDKGIVRFLLEENGNAKFVVGSRAGRISHLLEIPQYAEFEVF